MAESDFTDPGSKVSNRPVTQKDLDEYEDALEELKCEVEFEALKLQMASLRKERADLLGRDA